MSGRHIYVRVRRELRQLARVYSSHVVRLRELALLSFSLQTPPEPASKNVNSKTWHSS